MGDTTPWEIVLKSCRIRKVEKHCSKIQAEERNFWKGFQQFKEWCQELKKITLHIIWKVLHRNEIKVKRESAGWEKVFATCRYDGIRVEYRKNKNKSIIKHIMWSVNEIKRELLKDERQMEKYST